MRRTKLPSPNIKCTYIIDDEPLIISKKLIDTLLQFKNRFSDLLSLYCFYYYTDKWQHTDQLKITINYTAKEIGWGRNKVIYIKSILKRLGLIEDIVQYDSNGRIIGYFVKVYLVWCTTPLIIPEVLKSDFRDEVGKLNFRDKTKNFENSLIPLKSIKQTYSPNNRIHTRTRGPAQERVLKEKNTKKEKESIFFGLFNMFKDEWKNNESFKKSIQDYVIHRKEIRQTLTPLACKRLANHLSKYKLPIVIQAIEKSIINGWTGIFPESIVSSKDNKYKPTYKEWEGRRYYLCPDGEYRNKAGSLFIE